MSGVASTVRQEGMDPRTGAFARLQWPLEARAGFSDLAEQLRLAREEERRHISVELHNSTGQHLVAAGLALARLEDLVSMKGELASVFDDLRSSVLVAQREVRTLSYLLNPPNLRRHGLAPSIQRLADGFARRSAIAIICRIRPGHPGDDGEADRALFRIVQEALVNIHRHAGASTVRVTLATSRCATRLRIVDDGRGIAVSHRPAGTADELGVGIRGMREGIEAVRGTLTIRSGPWGTELCATVPRRGAEMRWIEEVLGSDCVHPGSRAVRHALLPVAP